MIVNTIVIWRPEQEVRRSQFVPKLSQVSCPAQQLHLILQPTSSTLRSGSIEHNPAGRDPDNELFATAKETKFLSMLNSEGIVPVKTLLFNVSVLRSSIDPSCDGIEPTSALPSKVKISSSATLPNSLIEVSGETVQASVDNAALIGGKAYPESFR
jgi:hypothetical protein